MRNLASILFSSSVGRWVDQSPDRLRTLLSTISVNRISVLCASVLWFFIVQPDNGDDVSPFSTSGSLGVSHVWREALFALIIATGILEGLSASGNMLSLDRDWVVTAASPYGQRYDLTELNSSMRRIDLICKLIAPIAISVAISLTNIRIGVTMVGTMSTISWTAECWCARRVWLRNPKLMAPKTVTDRDSQETMTSPEHTSFFSRAGQNIRRYVADFRMYFSSPVWIPSLSLALLHISALAYNATFMTYLLAVGFSLDLITFARAAGSVVEISSTVVTPAGVKYLGNPKTQGHHSISRDGEGESAGPLLETPQEADGAKTEMGLERLGLWGISFQLINLVILPTSHLSPIIPLLNLPAVTSCLCPLESLFRSNYTLCLSSLSSLYWATHLSATSCIYPLLLPFDLPAWPLDLRPHDATAHTIHDGGFPAIFICWGRI